MKRLRNPLVINRPFAIFVQEDDSSTLDNPLWNATIVGHGMDNVACHDTPISAINGALELLCMLTGTCINDMTECDFSKESEIESYGAEGTPAWECTRCDSKASKGEFDEIAIDDE